MDIIETKIDVNSELYRKNLQDMTALVQDLEKELDKAANERSAKALKRHEESGKLDRKSVV